MTDLNQMKLKGRIDAAKLVAVKPFIQLLAWAKITPNALSYAGFSLSSRGNFQHNRQMIGVIDIERRLFFHFDAF